MIDEHKLTQNDAEETLKKEMKYIQISDTKSIDNKYFEYYQIKHKKIIGDKKLRDDIDTSKREFLKIYTHCYFTLSIDIKRTKISKDYILIALKDHYSKVLEENTKDLEGYNNEVKQPKALSPDEIKKKRIEIEDEALQERFGRITNIPYSSQKPILDQVKQKYPQYYNDANTSNLSQNQNSERENIKLYDKTLNLNPNINIGGQAGFNTKVILRALHGVNYVKQKKEILARNFKKHEHDNPSIPTAPRYLKLANNFTIGWCNLEVVERIC